MPNNVYIWPLRKQRETLSHSDVLLTLSWRPRAARLSELSISILQNVETKRECAGPKVQSPWPCRLCSLQSARGRRDTPTHREH